MITRRYTLILCPKRSVSRENSMSCCFFFFFFFFFFFLVSFLVSSIFCNVLLHKKQCRTLLTAVH